MRQAPWFPAQVAVHPQMNSRVLVPLRPCPLSGPQGQPGRQPRCTPRMQMCRRCWPWRRRGWTGHGYGLCCHPSCPCHSYGTCISFCTPPTQRRNLQRYRNTRTGWMLVRAARRPICNPQNLPGTAGDRGTEILNPASWFLGSLVGAPKGVFFFFWGGGIFLTFVLKGTLGP